MKINFTKEHAQKLQSLLINMLMENEVIYNTIGQPINVVELLHTTTINSLNTLRVFISNKIHNLENQDEWITDSITQKNLEKYKTQKELINLVIGYKRHKMEVENLNRKKKELSDKIARMQEEAKTPEDRLKEAEEELKALETFDF